MPEVVLQSLTNPQYNMHVHIPDGTNTSSENAGGVRPHVSTTIVASTSQPSTHRAALPSPFRQYAGPVNGIAICDDADLAKMGHLYELYSFTKLPCLHGEGTKRSAAPLPEELCIHAVYSDDDDDDDDNGGNASDDEDEMDEDDESKTPCVDGRHTQGIALAKVNSLSSAEVNMTVHACPSVHTVTSSSATSSSSSFTTPLSGAYTARHNQSSLTTPTSSSISSSMSSQMTMSSSERQKHKSTGSRFAFWHRVPSSLPNKVITERGKTLHVAYSARAQKGKSAKRGANVCEASELYESSNSNGSSNSGGFVIFADSLVNAKPRSAIAVVTRAYKQVSGLHNSNDANSAGDGLNDLKLPDAKRYIREVLQGGRPLFRRRPSAVVYGSGWYIPQPTKDTQL